MQEIILSVYAIIAFIAALIIVKTERKSNSIGTKIEHMMGAVFCMIIFYGANFVVENQLVVKIAGCLSFFMLDFLVLFFLDYVLEFLEWQEKFSKVLWGILYVCIFLDGISLLSNPFNHDAFAYRNISLGDLTILGIVPKAPFHGHLILVVAIVIIAVFFLILKGAQAPRIYWKRYYCIWFGMILAVITNCVYFAELFQLKLDVSIFAYVLLGSLLYFNTFKYQSVVNKEITRGVILDYLAEPILLFDYEGILADYTIHMKELFPESALKTRQNQNGKPLTRAHFMEYAGIREIDNLSEAKEFEHIMETKHGKRIFHCKYDCLQDKGKVVGYSLVFHDVTSLKEAYYALEQSITYDKLTGFFNKRSFYSQIPQWEDDRYWPVTTAVFNINNLQVINDSYGTEYGDQVMLALGAILKKYIGAEHFIAKVDGGDIVAVFENTDQEHCIEICEKIRNKMETVLEDNPITLEYGVAEKTDDSLSVEKAFKNARNSMRKKKMLRDTSASRALVDSLKQTLSESDYETEEHVERTREMAARLGKEMGLSDSDIAKLELLAVLHDIGKVAIPHSVLLKKGKLNDEERKIMQEHTVKGYRIAKSSPELEEIADCILSHHEKWDGTGYPNGLKGEEIPLLARVISAVDSHDVMVHNRPYHTAMPEQAAIDELKACAGTQFDPHVVEVFVNLLEREELNKATENR